MIKSESSLRVVLGMSCNSGLLPFLKFSFYRVCPDLQIPLRVTTGFIGSRLAVAHKAFTSLPLNGGLKT